MTWTWLWLLLGGWGYAVVGLVVGFLLFAFHVIHAERCDNCTFGYDVANWKSATLLSKFGVVLSIGSVITWPFAALYTLFVSWPATICERLFARPQDDSIQSIVRAWYKRNRLKGWQIHVNEDSSGKKRSRVSVQIYHNSPTASIKVNDDKCELEWSRSEKSKDGEHKWARKTISPGDPKFFDIMKQFMKDVNSGKQI